MFTGNTVRRGLALVVFTLAAAALGAGVAFWRAGREMVVMTLLFGGSGIYLIIEGLGLFDRASPASQGEAARGGQPRRAQQ